MSKLVKLYESDETQNDLGKFLNKEFTDLIKPFIDRAVADNISMIELRSIMGNVIGFETVRASAIRSAKK